MATVKSGIAPLYSGPDVCHKILVNIQRWYIVNKRRFKFTHPVRLGSAGIKE